MTRLERLISLRPNDFQTDLVNFLHELEYCKSNEEFRDLTDREPRENLTEHWFHYVMVAGIIEFFSRRKGFDAPQWVLNDKYVLQEEWWALDDAGEYKARLFIFSPACFMRRNIFIDGETLIPI